MATKNLNPETHTKITVALPKATVEALDRLATYQGASRAETLERLISLADDEASGLLTEEEFLRYILTRGN